MEDERLVHEVYGLTLEELELMPDGDFLALCSRYLTELEQQEARAIDRQAWDYSRQFLKLRPEDLWELD